MNTLSEDVRELLRLYREWQRENGETVEHAPVRTWEVEAAQNREYHRRAEEAARRHQPAWAGQEALLGAVEKRIEEAEREMQRRRDELERLEAQIDSQDYQLKTPVPGEADCVYVPLSIDPVLEAEKLKRWHMLRRELGIDCEVDMKWLEDIVDDAQMSERTIRWVWKRSRHLRGHR